jgi:chromosome partitioning protein
MKTIAFLNYKGGVGKTRLAYDLAWMFAELGLNGVAADLDPQANLSSMFLDDDTLEEIWTEPQTPRRVAGSLTPRWKEPAMHRPSSRWPDCLERKPIALRVITAFWRLLAKAAAERQTDVVLIDVATNLGPTLRGWREGLPALAGSGARGLCQCHVGPAR